jgi:hypothetical protein
MIHIKPVITKMSFLFLLLLHYPVHSESLMPLDFTKADKIEIHFKNNRKQLKYVTTGKNHLSFFKDLIIKSKNNSNLKCDTTGEILYIKDNQLIFKVFFSTHITGSKFRSSTITYTIDNHPTTSLFTYNAGMVIDELYYKLKTTN